MKQDHTVSEKYEIGTNAVTYLEDVPYYETKINEKEQVDGEKAMNELDLEGSDLGNLADIVSKCVSFPYRSLHFKPTHMLDLILALRIVPTSTI